MAPRWPRLRDRAALLLAFNLCVAPVADVAAGPETGAAVIVIDTAFTPGQGDNVSVKARAKGAQMLEHYSSDEWADRMAHEDWMETVKAAGEHVKEAFKDAEHVAYLTGRGPLIVQRPYNYADSKSAATYN